MAAPFLRLLASARRARHARVRGGGVVWMLAWAAVVWAIVPGRAEAATPLAPTTETVEAAPVPAQLRLPAPGQRLNALLPAAVSVPVWTERTAPRPAEWDVEARWPSHAGDRTAHLSLRRPGPLGASPAPPLPYVSKCVLRL